MKPGVYLSPCGKHIILYEVYIIGVFKNEHLINYHSSLSMKIKNLITSAKSTSDLKVIFKNWFYLGEL